MQKKSTRFALIALLTIFGYFTIEYFSNKHLESESEEAENDRMDLAMQQEFKRTKAPGLNRIPTDRLLHAAAFRDSKLAARNSMKTATAVPGISWTERGPNNVGGRSRVAWFDRNDAGNGYKKVWAAGVGGGLWYTNDITAASPSWNKVNDLFDNIAVTAFVQSTTSPNTMYFGTGEGWFNFDAIQGLGIWKSTDGGANWTQLSSTLNFAFVQDLLIDQNGHLYASLVYQSGSHARGIQKSTDGGTTWTQVAGNPVAGFPSGRGCDLEMAANGDLYASLGNFSEGRIYRSSFATNGANTGNTGTWTDITPQPATNALPAVGDNYNRIELVTAPSDANVLYGIFEANTGFDVSDIKQYDAATNTWVSRTVPNYSGGGPYTRGQAWYDLIGRVDPNNANTLYIGGIDVYKSTNNGTAWTRVSDWRPVSLPYVHSDIHEITYAPGSSSRILIGCDGGLYYSADANLSTPAFTDKNSGYNVTQFYTTAMHPSNANYFLAGAQDNGTQKFSAAGINNTIEVTGGDGGFCHIDQDNPLIQISSYVYNQYYVSTDGGNTFAQRFKNTNGDFINPTDYDNTANILYGGSVNGEYFRWLNPATNGADVSMPVTQFAGGFITHVMVSELTANRVYFGLDNGTVVRVDNANGASPSGSVIFNQSIAGSISCVAIDPANENHLLVTLSNYGVSSIWETTNGGGAWTAVEGNLPDMPVRWAMFDPRNSDWAIIATELGIWSTDNLNAAATDWNPTNSGLANVRVDMMQYRTGDRTIAAATHGRGLYTAVVPLTSTPDISFASVSANVTELSSGSSGCRSYTDYSVDMQISNAPVGDATVTLAIQAGSTATSNVDFNFTTNGNFSSPSNTLVFTDGLTTNKTINIRVYDDAEVESSKQFTLIYSISGTTNAVSGFTNQTYTFTINDNDSAPTAASSATNTIAAFDINASATSPFQSNNKRAKAQYLITAAELSAGGMIANRQITQLAWNIITKLSSAAFTGFTISMAHTNAANLNAGYISPTFTQVYTGNYSSSGTGWQTIALSTPFTWDGTSNLVVQACFDNGGGGATPGIDVVQGTAAPLGVGVKATAINATNGASTAGCALTTSGQSDSRPQFRFTQAVPQTPVESSLNASKSTYLGPNSDVYFYSSTDGELIARIKNLSSHDYGCTSVQIDRAGTGSSQFWNAITSNYLLNKSFRVIPTTNNLTGQYQITLYFSQAEILGWQTATGELWANMQLIKLPSQISNVTPATPEPDGIGTVQVVSPTLGTLGTHYTITYTFNNGFSGFGAGVPGASGTLPVTLLSFNARLVKENAQLEWSTSIEQNNRGFEIEKSFDGINFKKIGFVASAGNSTATRHYNFTDPQKAVEYNYYRLKIVDLDNAYKYSDVALVKNISTKQDMIVMGNPFNNQLSILFQKTPGDKVAVSIYDMKGSKIFAAGYNKPDQSILQVNTGGKFMTAGIYSVVVETGGKIYKQKIMKQ